MAMRSRSLRNPKPATSDAIAGERVPCWDGIYQTVLNETSKEARKVFPLADFGTFRTDLSFYTELATKLREFNS